MLTALGWYFAALALAALLGLWGLARRLGLLALRTAGGALLLLLLEGLPLGALSLGVNLWNSAVLGLLGPAGGLGLLFLLRWAAA